MTEKHQNMKEIGSKNIQINWLCLYRTCSNDEAERWHVHLKDQFGRDEYSLGHVGFSQEIQTFNLDQDFTFWQRLHR